MQQLHLPGVEGIGNGVAILAGVKVDAVHREGLLLPPAPVGREVGTLRPGGGYIGIAAGAQGHEIGLRARFNNGDVQKGDEGGVGPGETDDEGLRPIGTDGGHLAEAAAVAGGGLSPAHSGSGVRGGEGGAIGKGDAAAQLDGPGIAGGIVAPRLSQDGLGLHFQIQLHQPLIEQAADILLGAVTAGDGIQGQPLEIGQGKGADGDILVLVFLLIVVSQLVVDLIGVGIGSGTAAAQQGQQHPQGQKQAEQTFFSHVGSSSASRAICAPRAFPTLRWDQYSS